jgi:hypothetical protein
MTMIKGIIFAPVAPLAFFERALARANHLFVAPLYGRLRL